MYDLNQEEQAVIAKMRMEKAGEYLAAKMLEIGQDAIKDLAGWTEKRLESRMDSIRKDTRDTKLMIASFTTPRIQKILGDEDISHKVWTETVEEENEYSTSIYPSTFGDFEEQADNDVFWKSITVKDFGLDPEEWEWEDKTWFYEGKNEWRYSGYLKKTVKFSFEAEKADFTLYYDAFRENTWNDKEPAIERESFTPSHGKKRYSGTDYDKMTAPSIFGDWTKRTPSAIAKRIIERGEAAKINRKQYFVEKKLVVLVEKKTKELLGDVPKSYSTHKGSWQNMRTTARFEDGSSMEFKLDVSYEQYDNEDFDNCELELAKVYDAQELSGQERFDYFVNKIVKQNS